MEAGPRPLPSAAGGAGCSDPPSGPVEVSLSTVVQHSATDKGTGK